MADTVYAEINPGVRRTVPAPTLLSSTEKRTAINQLKNPTSVAGTVGIPKHVSNVAVRTSVSGTTTNFVVSWNQDPTDKNYTAAHVHITGYKGSTTPQRILTNKTSPAIFNLDSTNEPINITVQAAGNKGTADLGTAPTVPGVAGKPKFGGYGSKVTALTSADQIGGTVGGGPCPVKAPTTVTNALTTGGALTQWQAAQTVLIPGSIEFDVQAVSGGLVDVLLFTGETGSNPNGYIFRLDARTAKNAGQILVITNGTWSNIGTAQTAANSGALTGWHHVKAQVATGNVLSIWVDGTLQYTATDKTYTFAQNIPTYYGYELVTSSVIAPTGKTQITVDNVPDGSTYARQVASDMTSNRLDFSKSLLNKGALATKNSVDLSTTDVSNKILDNLSDGTYAKVVSTALSSGSVLAAHISNQAIGQQAVGSTLTSGTPPSITITGWRTVSSTTINIPAGTSSITLTGSWPVQGAGVSAGSTYTGIGFAIYSGSNPGTPQVSVLNTFGSYSLTLSSPTTGNGLTLTLYIHGSGTSDSKGAVLVSLTQTVVQILNAGAIT